MAAARRPVGDEIPLAAARRIALTAQGFAEPRPRGRVDVRHLGRAVGRTGVLQLDAVNVLCRSHYLPPLSRLGPYPRATLDRMCWGSGEDRQLFEYFWGHKAALLPLSYHRLVRARMRVAERQDGDAPPDPELAVPWAVVVGMRRLRRERPRLVDEVLAAVTDRGPITAGEAGADGVRRARTDPDPGTGRMWNWQDAKIAIEYLFCTGRVTVADRRHFERRYDLTERVLPAAVLAEPEAGPDEAYRDLVRIAARTMGVATARELTGANVGHYPLSGPIATRVLGELVDAGDLVRVRVEGESRQGYLWSGARDRPVAARALLSPFDPLIWNRDRTERLFGFHYRISIYTPAAQRVHGYYVLPLLLGDRLVARVDLAAERGTSTLRVPTVTAEPGVPDAEIAGPLAAELALTARWLELDRVRVDARTRLGRAVAAAATAG